MVLCQRVTQNRFLYSLIIISILLACYYVANFFFNFVLLWGPLFAGVPFRPSMLNMPKSASVYKWAITVTFHTWQKLTLLCIEHQRSISCVNKRMVLGPKTYIFCRTSGGKKFINLHHDTKDSTVCHHQRIRRSMLSRVFFTEHLLPVCLTYLPRKYTSRVYHHVDNFHQV